MKKIPFLFAFLMYGLVSKAQITMTLQVPLTGIIQKNQLWSALYVNSDAESAYMQLSLVLTNTTTNQQALTGTSNVFILNNGTTQILSGDVEPIEYTYPNPEIINQDPYGFIPVGEYEACYTLSRQVGEVFQVVTETCINITVEPLSPPLLNIPYDEAVVDMMYPQFTWLPPAPLNIFNNLSYDFILVEKQEGQSAIEAIQQNIPIYTQGNVADIFLNYPISNAPLDTAKIYVWQVIAKDNNQFAAQSEVWTFSIKQDSIPQIITSTGMPYVRLKRELDATVAAIQDTLKFVYYNEPLDSTVSYSVSSLEEANLGTEMDNGTLHLKTGENYIDIPYVNDSRLIDNNTYLLTLTNSRNERWMMKFIYRIPDSE